MKKIFISFLILLYVIFAIAQNSGRGFSYQAVARNSDGQPQMSKNIELQFSLLPSQQAITPSWQETHVATTDELGTFALIVGKGIKTGGIVNQYKDVNFASADYWLKIELKETDTWHEISFFQLPSVPYAESAGNAQGVPVGSIIAFGGPRDKIPTGWLACDGKTLSRTEYAALYATVGTAWGHGDGANTFHLPSLDGMFLRGVDFSGAHDDDRNNRFAKYPGGNTNVNVGSYQGESFQRHNHTGTTSTNGAHSHKVYTRANSGSPTLNTTLESGNLSESVNTSTEGNHSFTTNISGGNETRPENAYVNYIIKY